MKNSVRGRDLDLVGSRSHWKAGEKGRGRSKVGFPREKETMGAQGKNFY